MTAPDLVTGVDGKARCGWAGDDPGYVAYHEEEWGVPVHDEHRLFEKLCLEGFQSGVSWLTILRKRPAFRVAFADFDPDRVARFADDDVARLLGDAGIVRHRGKITATIANARATVALHAAGESLDALLWEYAAGAVHGDPPAPVPQRLSDLPATTPASTALAKALKRRGFRFVGPTTAYAAMQALGLVDDHLTDCWRRSASST